MPVNHWPRSVRASKPDALAWVPLPRTAISWAKRVAVAGRRSVRHGPGRDEVAANDIDRIELEGPIQIPGGTEPIVLHRDAVSGGGYFMLGAVISADMDLIGQMQPHTPTRFVPVDMATALDARRERRRLIERLRQALAQP